MSDEANALRIKINHLESVNEVWREKWKLADAENASLRSRLAVTAATNAAIVAIVQGEPEYPKMPPFNILAMWQSTLKAQGIANGVTGLLNSTVRDTKASILRKIKELQDKEQTDEQHNQESRQDQIQPLPEQNQVAAKTR